MAYNPAGLFLVRDSLSGAGKKEWELHTTDAIADVNTSNYISDGVKRGLSQGDTVKVVIRASLPSGAVSAIHLCWVIDVGTGTDTLGVDLTDGLAITATDTD